MVGFGFLTTMVTMTEFTNFTYFTAEFFMMNMKVLSPKVGKVRSRNGHVFVEIATTRNITKTVVVLDVEHCNTKPCDRMVVGLTTTFAISA
jgi:hypothetical protein